MIEIIPPHVKPCGRYHFNMVELPIAEKTFQLGPHWVPLQGFKRRSVIFGSLDTKDCTISSIESIIPVQNTTKPEEKTKDDRFYRSSPMSVQPSVLEIQNIFQKNKRRLQEPASSNSLGSYATKTKRNSKVVKSPEEKITRESSITNNQAAFLLLQRTRFFEYFLKTLACTG